MIFVLVGGAVYGNPTKRVLLHSVIGLIYFRLFTSSFCCKISEIVLSKITTTSVLQESTKNDLQTSDPSSASLVVAVVPTAVSIAVLTTIAVIISVSIFWCYRKRRSKLIKTKR